MGPPLLCIFFILITVVGAVELDQKISVTVPLGTRASIHCTYGTGCYNYIHWYQKKEEESFKRILYILISDGTRTNDPDYKDHKNFETEKKGKEFNLKIPNVKSFHRAVYYCACWDSAASGYIKRFGPGTRLFVTDDAVRQPTVNVYSSTKSQKENTFLCHASNMFPDLVRFHWKVFKAGKWENVVKNDREVLETSFSDKTNTSIMIIDKQKAGGNRYACSYTHEALREGKESKPLEIEGKKGGQTEPVTKPQAKTSNVTVCSTPNDTAISTLHQLDEYFGAARSLYLATWVYTLMIFKSTVYFCAISYFICTKNMRSKRSLNRRAP